MRKISIFPLAALLLGSCNFNVPANVSNAIVQTVSTIINEQPASTGEVTDGLMELPAIESDDIILTHKGFTLSYNSSARIPEWVAYELTADETRGEADRDDAMFQMDPSYRSTQAMREDYTGSGWTKGHMACAADFHWDEEAMDETFYLTNICPQSEKLNAGDWEFLERRVRAWARDYGKVWIVAGPIIGNNSYGTIGRRTEVTVPDAFFKAVMAYDGMKYISVAFVMGNDDERYYLRDCAMSVDELEKMTGYDLFASLDDDIEDVAESTWEGAPWGIR